MCRIYRHNDLPVAGAILAILLGTDPASILSNVISAALAYIAAKFLQNREAFPTRGGLIRGAVLVFILEISLILTSIPPPPVDFIRVLVPIVVFVVIEQRGRKLSS